MKRETVKREHANAVDRASWFGGGSSCVILGVPSSEAGMALLLHDANARHSMSSAYGSAYEANESKAHVCCLSVQFSLLATGRKYALTLRATNDFKS